ncbi:MAG: delta-aminolevulinic acid dehydratase [Bacteroidales bacterium]|nr:delta-aminolevulinic acid dehydratase [Bacteroidales bacterium]
MKTEQVLLSFQKLENYCYQEDWKGWDPYDGLNSKVFKALPLLKKSELIRMAWIQFFKHSPLNLRRLFLVPKGYNAKGIGLFLTGYCNIYNAQCISAIEDLGSQEEFLKKIRHLADLLCTLQSKGYSGACWGYNFDWQSKAFFLPNQTPTIVATSFVVEALLKAYEITRGETYINTALSSAEFIRNDLNRIPKQRGFMFSYSPLDQRAVYNASLLGTKTLSLLYHFTKNEDYKKLAFQSAQAVCDLQNTDGSFPHSDQVGNKWKDSFHTAFKLESLAYYQKYCSDESFMKNIEKGYNHWVENFFDKQTGIALYYENNFSLIDLHCTAQSLATFYTLDKFKTQYPLVTKILQWAIDNMQDKRGYFYFQKRKNRNVKIQYMRWPNAWMFYGISFYILSVINYEKDQGIN